MEKLTEVVHLAGDKDVLVIWPTDLEEHEVIKQIANDLTTDAETAAWKTEVIASSSARPNDKITVLSVAEFLAANEPQLTDGSGIVRFNAGGKLDGFSVSAAIEAGRRELQGVFAPGAKKLAERVLRATISAEATDQVAALVEQI